MSDCYVRPLWRNEDSIPHTHWIIIFKLSFLCLLIFPLFLQPPASLISNCLSLWSPGKVEETKVFFHRKEVGDREGLVYLGGRCRFLLSFAVLPKASDRRRRPLSRHESEQTPGDSEGQGSLVCCSPWGGRESDMT